MKLANKLFPYPVLNSYKPKSGYSNSDFSFTYDESKDEKSNKYYIKNGVVQIQNNSLIELYNNEYIKLFLIVECPGTFYRKIFEIRNNEPFNFEFNKADFAGDLEVSCFACITQNCQLKDNDFIDIYQNITFELEKHDIVAGNDGYKISIERNSKEDNLVSSIFCITCNEKLESGLYSVDFTENKINVYLAKEEFEKYNLIYQWPDYKEIYFNILLIPPLIKGIYLCKSIDANTFDDIVEKYLWFDSILKSYKRLKGIDLSFNDFMDDKFDATSFAQIVFGLPFGKSIDSLEKIMEKHQKEDIDNE